MVGQERSYKHKGKNLGQTDIKIRILCYLFNLGEDGTNAYMIQRHCVRTTQDTSRFKRLLDDLYDLRRIDRKDRSDLHKGLITYNVTQKGRETVQVLRNELVKEFIIHPWESTKWFCVQETLEYTILTILTILTYTAANN